MTKILYQEINRCQECPFYKYEDGDCHPDTEECNHPKAEFYILSQYFHKYKTMMSSESNYTEEFTQIPKWCPLEDKREIKIIQHESKWLCGCAGIPNSSCICQSKEYKEKQEILNKVKRV